MELENPDKDSGTRLDSWKAIAAYLKRDERTVRRWERELGLPIRRVSEGRGASVFAYSSEIDAWLTRDSAATPSTTSGRARWWTAAALATVLIGVAAIWWWPRTIDTADMRLDVTATGVTAYNGRGVEQWRDDFPAGYSTAFPGLGQAWSVVPGSPPLIVAATSGRTRAVDGQAEGGVLRSFSVDGRVEREFAFDDEVTVAGTRFGPPWWITAIAAEAATPHRIAISAHHWNWNPGLVTILDTTWHRRGTFVHPGWVETVRWLSPTSLLIGGYSNAREGGMVAILHPDELEGQAPEQTGSPHHCESCGSHTPVRMVIMPRTEVNRAAAAPFNRAIVSITPSRVIAHTVEVASEQGPAEAIYEFTPSLDLVSANFGERYWDMHRALELQGKINHPAAQCPDRAGPSTITLWDRIGGWREMAIRHDGESVRR